MTDCFVVHEEYAFENCPGVHQLPNMVLIFIPGLDFSCSIGDT